ncbi:MAG: cytochrome c3 family protein [Candidatus Kapabacteria bacterium]|nr:cytochrome c3 family protein [Candidatus Kapabacteria bacterium]
MRNKILLILLLPAFIIVSSNAYSKGPAKIKAKTSDLCSDCHEMLDAKFSAPAKAYSKDIHKSKGVTCAGCHGGDASKEDQEAAMDKKKGFIGIPSNLVRYKTCVKCHSDEKEMAKYGSKIKTDQFENLKNSVHFRQTAEGSEFITDCITCHGVHNITNVKAADSKVNPLKVPALCGSCHSNVNYMKKYNQKLPTDQVEKYKTSLHGQMNAKGNTDVAECVNCHGNHGIRKIKDPISTVYPWNIPKTCANCHSKPELMKKYNLPSNQFDEYASSVHGKAVLKKFDVSAPTCNSCHGSHGATPPGIESISNVCGTCHNFNGELFAKSPHKAAFDKKHLPECETCHGNHGIKQTSEEMIGIGEKSVCIKCHKDNNDKGYEVSKIMWRLLDSLRTDTVKATNLLNRANDLEMDVSDAVFALKDVKQILIQSRTQTHLGNLKDFQEGIKPGFEMTRKAITSGNEAIDDYYFRRSGLGIATLFMAVLAIVLYMKIKKIEKK